MQTIYVDILLFLNIFINYFLLLCVKKFLHISIRTRRLVLGSLFGSIFSLLAFFPRINPVLNLIITVLSGGMIIFVTFGKCKPNIFIKRTAAFLFTSIGFCGIMIFIYLAFQPNGLVISNSVVYFNISPVVLVLLTVVCYFILRLIQRITGKQEAKELICDIKVFYENKNFAFKGKVDTGCTLREPFSHAPVIVAEKSLFNGNFYENKEKMRVIPFDSLGGNGILEGYKPDYIYINDEKAKEDIYIGLCENILNGEVKALVNSEIIKG